MQDLGIVSECCLIVLIFVIAHMTFINNFISVINPYLNAHFTSTCTFYVVKFKLIHKQAEVVFTKIPKDAVGYGTWSSLIYDVIYVVIWDRSSPIAQCLSWSMCRKPFKCEDTQWDLSSNLVARAF